MNRCLRALALAWALLLAGGAAAQAPTLKTINVDGNLADWDEVLLNPRQVTLDGDGSSLPCQYSTDRDCIVQSNGRDLRMFAWTYDATHVYYYVLRQGSTSNNQNFWFYMDLNLDDRMGFGDLVLRVNFNGSTGLTQNDLFRYLPNQASGDPMVGAAGFADGHDMPGNLQATAIWSEASPNGGAPDGRAFEERVPWTALGVPSATPVKFHVGSSNSPNPQNLAAQVDDNLGGPGGSAGSFGYEGVDVTPDQQSASIAPGSVARYAHAVRNTGTTTSSFTITTTSTLGLMVLLHEDANGDTLPESLVATDANGDGDYADAGDALDGLRDTNGDTLPDTPTLAPGASWNLVVDVQSLPIHDGLRDTTRVRAYIPAVPYATDAALDVTDIGDLVLRTDDDDKNSVDNQNVSFALELCNNGTADTLDVTAVSASGWQVSVYSDPECDGVANDFLAQDRTGDGTWDTLVAGDSDGDTIPDSGSLAQNACACFVLVVRVPNREPIGTTSVITVAAAGSALPTNASLPLTIRVTQRLELFPDHLVANGTAKVSGDNRPVYFAHVARNNWLVADRVDFTRVVPVNDQGWTVRIWSDPNGDGNIFDGSLITLTGLIPPNGGELPFVVEVRVPSGVPSGVVARTVVTGAAQLDPAVRDTVIDEQEVSSIATYSDPLFRIAERFFAPCDTIFVEGSGLEPPGGGGPVDVYDLVYFDGAGNNVRFHDPLVPDIDGVARDQHVPSTTDVPGTWRIELREDTLTIASVDVSVEATVSALLTTGSPIYPLTGAGLDVDVELSNANLVAPIKDGRVDYVVLDPTRTQYLVSGASSSFQPWTGAEVTRTLGPVTVDISVPHPDPFVVPNVTYPAQGAYVVRLTWYARCGIPLLQREVTFAVGSGEDCANRSDDDGDTFADCDDPECAGSPACVESPCDDGLDSDGDTFFDCDDPDCALDPACRTEEDCSDGVDDDGDRLTDCEDPDCATDPACPEPDCRNGSDDDGDTLTDCEDSDCAGIPPCVETACANSADDDGDSFTDCDDPDCAFEPNCLPELDCSDRADNDLDSFTDCDDPDCAGAPACTETNCADTVDNDGDSFTDCDDPDCVGQPACTETNCADTVDNDGDSFTDCDDPDCAGQPACVETNCADTVDNDGDSFTDCDDPDCAGAPNCDSDGDTVADQFDCAPSDATTWAVPGEVDLLLVRRASGGGADDAIVSWPVPSVPGGTAPLYDVVSGVISQMLASRGLLDAICLDRREPTTSTTDARPLTASRDGYWYLVRAGNSCGFGEWGSSSMGPRILPPACN